MTQSTMGKHTLKTKLPGVTTPKYQQTDNPTISRVGDDDDDKLPETTTKHAGSVSPRSPHRGPAGRRAVSQGDLQTLVIENMAFARIASSNSLLRRSSCSHLGSTHNYCLTSSSPACRAPLL